VCIADLLLPVLDILRLVLRDSVSNELFCKASGAGTRLVGYFCSVVNSGSGSFQSKNRLLIVRIMCNAFHHAQGQQLMLDNGERLLTLISVLLQQSSDKNLQVKIHNGENLIFSLDNPPHR
jgi:hypothetical protein